MKDPDLDAQYRHWRIRIFAGLFGGYALYYFTRKSFTYAMPILMADLGYERYQLGMVTTALSIAYAISKFTSGVLTDRTNPRYVMGLGLILSGVCNFLFGFSSSLLAFTVLWGLNGWFQGFGAPPCARLLISWYPKHTRGRWWAAWNTSHNIGSFCIGQFVGACLYLASWRLGLWAPGALCVVGGVLVMFLLRESPESQGLPPVEDGPATPKAESSPKKKSLKELLFDNVVKHPIVLLLGISYFFVYVVRSGISDWCTLYLVEARHYEAYAASSVTSLFEVGGLCGSLVAGWASDTVFHGRRGPVNVLMMIGVLCVMLGFLASLSFGVGIEVILVILSGFFIFGPQMLVGMSVAEIVGRESAATATGFVGIFAYLGAAAAGAPLGYLVDRFGWTEFFICMIMSSIIATLLLIPAWRAGHAPTRVAEAT